MCRPVSPGGSETYSSIKRISTSGRGNRFLQSIAPDLVSSEQEYLLALDTTSDLRRSDVQGVASGAEYLVQAAQERLKLFGVSPSEISRLRRERAVREAVEIDSP